MTASLGSAATAIPTPVPAGGVAGRRRAPHPSFPPTRSDGPHGGRRQRRAAEATLREALLAHAHPPRRFMRGQHLFYTDGREPSLYLIESGSVKLYGVTAGGTEQVLGFCFPGELIGLDVLGAPAHGSSAVALEPTTARSVPVRELQALCQFVPAVQQRIHWLLARRIADLREQIIALGGKRAEERLAGFLLWLDARLPAPVHATHTLQLSMTRYEIGCYLGVALETVSRMLRQFDDKGLTRTHGRSIQLRDCDRLRALAGLPAGARTGTHG